MESSEDRAYAGNERRAFPRLSVNIDVDYTVVEEDVLPQYGAARNISAGGICFLAYEKLSPGTLLFLSFSVPDEEAAINAQGKVVWQEESFSLSSDSSQRYDTGVEFVEIADTARAKIAAYVFSFQRERED